MLRRARGLRRHNTATAAAARRPRAPHDALLLLLLSLGARKTNSPIRPRMGRGERRDQQRGRTVSVGPLRSTDSTISVHTALDGRTLWARLSAARGARPRCRLRWRATVRDPRARMSSCWVRRARRRASKRRKSTTTEREATGRNAGTINYVHSTINFIRSGDAGEFDVVCALGIIEHVPRDCQHRFVFDCGSLVKPGGCMFVSTMNRTARASPGSVWRGSGDAHGAYWHPRLGKFVTPEELEPSRNGSMVGGLGKPKRDGLKAAPSW